MVGRGEPFHLKFWVNRPADFYSIFARNASAVASSKNFQLTLIGSRLFILFKMKIVHEVHTQSKMIKKKEK